MKIIIYLGMASIGFLIGFFSCALLTIRKFTDGDDKN